MITTLGPVGAAAPTLGTATPASTTRATTRAAAILRIEVLLQGGVAGPGAGGRAWSADRSTSRTSVAAVEGALHAEEVRGRMAPSFAAGWGNEPSGGVRATAVRCLRAPGQSRRPATSSASEGFVRSRPDRIGRPSGVPGTGCGQGTPTAGSSQAKPSSSLPSYSFVTR